MHKTKHFSRHIHFIDVEINQNLCIVFNENIIKISIHREDIIRVHVQLLFISLHN